MGDRPRARLGWLAVAGLIVALAAALRSSQLSARIFHHDEGVQAYRTWSLLRTGEFDYRPDDLHGPAFYDLSAAWFRFFGGGEGAMEDRSLRSIPAACGVAMVALLAGLGSARGQPGWILGAGLLAICPFAVLYDSYYIQESLFVLLSWALLLGFIRYLERPSRRWALALGASAGLLLAVKETAVLTFAAIALAAGVAFLAERSTSIDGRRRGVDGGLAALAAGVVVFAFYSRWGAEPQAVVELLESVSGYGRRALGSAGHTGPWLGYVALFWPRLAGGVGWSHFGLMLGGLLASGFALGRGGREMRMTAAYTLGSFVLYSIIPYKTPWLMLNVVVGWCLLLGWATVRWWRDGARRAGWRWVAPVACAVVALELVLMIRPVLSRYPGAERNPYLYNHTSPAFVDLLDRLEALRAIDPALRIGVMQADHAWPLPWYLRDWGRVGFFREGETVALERFDVVVLDAAVEPPGREALETGYVAELHGLRPNVLLEVHFRAALWESFIARPASGAGGGAP